MTGYHSKRKLLSKKKKHPLPTGSMLWETWDSNRVYTAGELKKLREYMDKVETKKEHKEIQRAYHDSVRFNNITCPRCGTDWTNDMIICENCGTELSERKKSE